MWSLYQNFYYKIRFFNPDINFLIKIHEDIFSTLKVINERGIIVTIDIQYFTILNIKLAIKESVQPWSWYRILYIK